LLRSQHLLEIRQARSANCSTSHLAGLACTLLKRWGDGLGEDESRCRRGKTRNR